MPYLFPSVDPLTTHAGCHLQSPPDLPLPKVNTKVGEFDGYATNDLVVPHPTISGMWKIVGRADEQIMLSNGEKVCHYRLRNGAQSLTLITVD